MSGTTLVLHVRLGNAACQSAADVGALIMEAGAEIVGTGSTAGSVRDPNGNRVGGWHLTGPHGGTLREWPAEDAAVYP